MSAADEAPTIYMETVSAAPNIACVKCWGKSNVEYNNPINSSVGVTLDQADLRAVTTASASKSFESNRVWINGKEDADFATSKMFEYLITRMKKIATDRTDPITGEVVVTKEEWNDMNVHVSSYTEIPTDAGLENKSTAAEYASLVSALSKLFCVKESYEGELSAITRHMSSPPPSSASQSLFGGFVAWKKPGASRKAEASIAEQVADEKHWPEIRALVLVVAEIIEELPPDGFCKSPEVDKLCAPRGEDVVPQNMKDIAKETIPQRLKDIEKAYLDKDFQEFGKIVMAEGNQFQHAVLNKFPPVFHINKTSRFVIRLIHEYNIWAGEIRAAYTSDVGPNIILFTLEEHAAEVGALMLHYYPAPEGMKDYVKNPKYASEIESYKLDEKLIEHLKLVRRFPKPGDINMMYYTKSGPGAQTLDANEAVIDPKTGKNTYKP